MRRPSGRAKDRSPGSGPERGDGPAPNASETRPPPATRAAAGTSGAAVVEQARDLLHWAIPAVQKFPRSFRFTLGERIERRLYHILEHLLRARYAPAAETRGHLDRANLDLEVLRHELRLAHEFRLLSRRQLEHAARLTDAAGRQVGAWRRSLR